jgi:hypothetical protein
MQEQIKLYQDTEPYKKSRDDFKRSSYEFSKEKLFPIFYDSYKFNIKSYNEGKSWRNRCTVFPAKFVKASINIMYKTKILKELEQLYNAMFVSISENNLQQSLQQETPAVAEDIIKTTERKIQTIFTKLFAEKVTISDYENASNSYLEIFEENIDDPDVYIKLFNDLIMTASNNKLYTNDEIAQQIKYILIAYLTAIAGYPKDALDFYLNNKTGL